MTTQPTVTQPAVPVPASVSPIYNPKVRGIAYQALLCLIILFLGYEAVNNAAENLERAHIASGFGFWSNTAGFDISQSLIEYSNVSTFGRAFWVGLLNTILVAALGIIFATIIGFAVGIGRLSKNWLIARLSGGYVEIIRNIPLLLQLLFWYNAVLKALPETRDSLSVFNVAFINNRGLFLPQPFQERGFGYVLAALALGIIGAIVVRVWARRRQMLTGQRFPVIWTTLALVIGLPLLVFAIQGFPVEFAFPKKGRFNVQGGIEVLPEFVALLFGLSVYTAAFIAEVVRAGILAVSHGQTEAAFSLGLKPRPTLRLVVVPQAMRVIIPPLTSQYLNLLKNSSLAVAIGYPDLVQVFAGSVLNITGQAVEVILITMGVYLGISLLTSFAMNLFNRRVMLRER